VRRKPRALAAHGCPQTPNLQPHVPAGHAMLERRDLILARYYGGKTPVPPALEDSIPEIAPIEPPVLPPILDTVVVDTLVVPDTTRTTQIQGSRSPLTRNPRCVGAFVVIVALSLPVVVASPAPC